MRTAVVIPVGPGREENLAMCIDSILVQTVKPVLIVLVMDGPDASVVGTRIDSQIPTIVVEAPKHEPGMEQPRNRGVREVERLNAEAEGGVDTVWFLDSDVIVVPNALQLFEEAMALDVPRVLVGPYDWLPAGTREQVPQLQNDPRWPSFYQHEPGDVLSNDLSAGLACFSGNLVWPIDKFTGIGGFWDALHHGRCEDGELGLRAVACGVPISFVRSARGWHLDHPINIELTLARNMRDVPMLNARHPWVQGEGLFVVEEDGKRFNAKCSCGWEGNTAELWIHRASCDGRFEA